MASDFFKTPPVKNKNLIYKLHYEPCLACGQDPPSDVHHIKTRGSGGGDDDFNCVSLCRPCHTKWHALGWKDFLKRNPTFAHELYKLGWEWSSGKLFHS